MLTQPHHRSDRLQIATLLVTGLLLFLSGCSTPPKSSPPPNHPLPVDAKNFPLPEGVLGDDVVTMTTAGLHNHVVVRGHKSGTPGFAVIDLSINGSSWVAVSDYDAVFSPMASERNGVLAIAFEGTVRASALQEVGFIEWRDGKYSVDPLVPERLNSRLTGLVVVDDPFLMTASRDLPTGLQHLWRRSQGAWTEIPTPELVRFAAPASLSTDLHDLFLCDDRADGSIVIHQLTESGTVLSTTTVVPAQAGLDALSLPTCLAGIDHNQYPFFAWLSFQAGTPGETAVAMWENASWKVHQASDAFQPVQLFSDQAQEFLFGNPWSDTSARQVLASSGEPWHACDMGDVVLPFGVVSQSSNMTRLAWLQNNSVVLQPLNEALHC
jgi:hypothetical protein